LFAENTVNQHTNYFQSTDFGETWSEFKFPFGKDTAVHHLFFDGFTIIATASTKVDDQYKGHKSYMIYASRDKGLSWQRYAESLPSNATITKFLRDGSTIYLLSTPGATGNAKVFISKDNWNSWAQLPGVVPDARWLFVDGSNVYLTTNLYGSIYQQSLESLTVKNPILNLQSSFTITPNPTSQNCTARFTKSPNTRIVKIVDICGRELQQYNLQPGTDVMVLQTADLPSGVYFVRVADGASISTVILQIQ